MPRWTARRKLRYGNTKMQSRLNVGEERKLYKVKTDMWAGQLLVNSLERVVPYVSVGLTG